MLNFPNFNSSDFLSQFAPRLTIPVVEHVHDEEVDEADLRLGDGAGSAVELGHDDGQPAGLLLLRLGMVGIALYITYTQSAVDLRRRVRGGVD